MKCRSYSQFIPISHSTDTKYLLYRNPNFCQQILSSCCFRVVQVTFKHLAMLQHTGVHLHLLTRLWQKLTIDLGVHFTQVFVGTLVAVNQKTAPINRNDVQVSLWFQPFHNWSHNANIRATSLCRSCGWVVVIDVDILCLRAIVVDMVFSAISHKRAPGFHVVNFLIVAHQTKGNRFHVLSCFYSF